MFEKLLSLLPYNPDLVHQMRFYATRMREEANIRRTGLIFLTLAFLIQFFAVLSPPQPTVASSSNDIINGGFGSIAEARRHCVANTQGFKWIMYRYGIKCGDFDNAENVTINSAARNNQYFSMGRNPTGTRGETPVNIEGAGKLYFRHLSAFGDASYRAVRVKNQDDKYFYILYSCGNLVSVGLPSPSPLRLEDTTRFELTPVPLQPTPAQQLTPAPQPAPTSTPPPAPAPAPTPVTTQTPPPTPSPAVRKTARNVTTGLANADGSQANAGDVIEYTLYAENKGKEAVDGFIFQENVNDVLDYADITDYHGGSIDSGGIVSWPAVKINAGATVTKQLTVRVKNPIPQTPVSASDPAHFDLIMTNVYGNAVNIKLPGSPAKSVEVAAASLPNAGPGATLAIAAGVVIMAGYLYARTRLIAIESKLAIKETAT